jgi:single-stranded-DNA-specific exonuclease
MRPLALPEEVRLIAPPVAEWVLHPGYDTEKAARLAGDLGAPLPAAHALVNRGILNLTRARTFLDPALEDLHDPSELLDLDRAVARIEAAIAAGESMLVHGDYDVDGITSTFMIYAVLRELGARVEYRIPHRTRDGYGLSERAVAYAAQRGHRLIVTVDSGITAVAPVAAARAAGIDVIITDHHEPPKMLPDAAAIVNPHREGCAYPFKTLAGVGVTFKLIQALLRGRGGIDRAREYLDVVALGTIADVVPLVGENRVLARLGLDQLNRTERLGLRALVRVSGLEGRDISGGQVAFVLAPRLNAAGRMGNAEQGVRLLLARDAGEAADCAQSLEEDNTRRRRFDEEALVEAAQRVESELGWPDCASILMWSDDWHPGVIGIVASRLVERFQRPTLLIAMDGERGRGSGRSLPGLDLHQLLGDCGDLLLAHGGHAFAAGLSVERAQLQALAERFDRLVRERTSPDARVPRLEVDDDLHLGQCDLNLVEWLERLSPYGLDNAEPLYRSRNLLVDQAATVGGGRHLKLRLRDATGSVDAIGFHMGERLREVGPAGRCEVAFAPTRNEWMGQTRIQLKLKGVRVP